MRVLISAVLAILLLCSPPSWAQHAPLSQEQLTERYPALAPHLDEGIAVAIDGQIFQDALLEPIGPDSEVYILPAIAGG